MIILTGDVVRTGATGAIAPVDFGKEAQIAPFVQNSITITVQSLVLPSSN